MVTRLFPITVLGNHVERFQVWLGLGGQQGSGAGGISPGSPNRAGLRPTLELQWANQFPAAPGRLDGLEQGQKEGMIITEKARSTLRSSRQNRLGFGF